MGFDISYHPIKEEEIQTWYFEALKNDAVIDAVIKNSEIDDFYAERYRETLDVARKAEPTEIFNKTHGFYIAIIQGFFRKYFYTRGSAFSFLIEENDLFKQYTKQWPDIIKEKIESPLQERITENYSAGVFISYTQVVQLLKDYQTNKAIQEALDTFYSFNRIKVFLNALQFAQEHEMGLLEATEVVEPEPFDLNSSTSYSNLYNCDREGVFLYAEAANKQRRDIIEQADKGRKKEPK